MQAKFETRFNGRTADYYEIVGVFSDVSLEQYAKIINIFEYETDIQTGYKPPYVKFLNGFTISIFKNIKINYTSKDSFELTLSMSVEKLEGMEKYFEDFFNEQFNK
jgi:hypothetical protein